MKVLADYFEGLSEQTLGSRVDLVDDIEEFPLRFNQIVVLFVEKPLPFFELIGDLSIGRLLTGLDAEQLDGLFARMAPEACT